MSELNFMDACELRIFPSVVVSLIKSVNVPPSILSASSPVGTYSNSAKDLLYLVRPSNKNKKFHVRVFQKKEEEGLIFYFKMAAILC